MGYAERNNLIGGIRKMSKPGMWTITFTDGDIRQYEVDNWAPDTTGVLVLITPLSNYMIPLANIKESYFIKKKEELDA